jgi:hypothetical protein
MSEPERCLTCRRPLPPGWLRSHACPWCNPSGPASDAKADRALAEAGHPKVSLSEEDDTVILGTRRSTTFGRVWLAFSLLVFGGIFISLLSKPDLTSFLIVGLFGGFFILFGLAFSGGTYRIQLQPECITVQWRIIGSLGWTWTLPAGAFVEVCLAYRGADSNNRPELAVVVTSQGKEISFGSFLADDVKEVLAATIRDYYAPVT